MPQLDFSTFMPQLVWLAITFTLLYLILTRIALPRIGGAIEQRQDKIADDLDRARTLKDETDKAIASYEQALAEARAKAHAIAQETRDRLAGEIEKEQARVEAQIADKVAAAEKQIARARQKAMSSVGEIALDVAGDIVAGLTGAKATRASLSGAVKQAMGEK